MNEELKELRKKQKTLQDAWRYSFFQILKKVVKERYPELLTEVAKLTDEEIKNHPLYEELKTCKRCGKTFLMEKCRHGLGEDILCDECVETIIE